MCPQIFQTFRRPCVTTKATAAHSAILDKKVHKLGVYISSKMQLVSYEYFYQCIMNFWGLRDSKGPILVHKAHLVQNNDIDPSRRFVNLFCEFSPLCAVCHCSDSINRKCGFYQMSKYLRIYLL